MSSFGSAAGGGPDDHAAGEAVLLAELADDAAQAPALFARLDLARDADVIDRRHEDQEAARHGDVRGEARALGAERLLDDLDEDFLPFLQQVFDLGFRAVASRAGPRRRGRGVRARAPPLRRRVAARRPLARAASGSARRPRSAAVRPPATATSAAACPATPARPRRRRRAGRTPRRC